MTNATNNFVLLKKSKEGVSKKNKKNVEVDIVVVCINLIWKSAVKKDSLTKMQRIQQNFQKKKNHCRSFKFGK